MEIEALMLVDKIGAVSILGLVGMTMVANIIPGIPEELFLLLVGVAVGLGMAPLWFAFFAVLIGLVIDDNIIYWGARKGLPAVIKWKDKFFGKKIDKNTDFITTHIGKIVFFSRFVFQVRFLGPFLAGMVRMPWKRYMVVEVIALAIYIPIMLLLGSYFQERITKLVEGVGVIRNIVLTILGAVVLILIIVYIQKKFKRRMERGDKSSLLQSAGVSKEGKVK